MHINRYVWPQKENTVCVWTLSQTDQSQLPPSCNPHNPDLSDSCIIHLKETGLINLVDTDRQHPKKMDKVNWGGFILRNVTSESSHTCSNLVAIVGPGSKGQVTFLAVKGEVGDVHHTGALGDGGSIPGYLSVVAQSHVGVHRPREVIVGSEGEEKSWFKLTRRVIWYRLIIWRLAWDLGVISHDPK